MNLTPAQRRRGITTMKPGNALHPIPTKPARAQRGTGDKARAKARKLELFRLLDIVSQPGDIEYRGHDAVMRNDWEREFAQYLQQCQRVGLVRAWAYEPMRFRVGVGAWFSPDYVVVRHDERVQCYDVKGFRREAALVRIKAAALRYPFFSWGLARLVKGAWRVEWVNTEQTR